jgi:fructokinase
LSFGALEMGGTHVVCLVGASVEEISARQEFATSRPDETLGRAVEFFQGSEAPLAAIGIGTFGPVELRPSHPRYGFITATPKPGWSNTDVLGSIRAGVGIPAVIDTDVNTAAIAEGRLGAGRSLDTFVYLTVGTGIGGGALVGGRPAHGLVHPEMGHVSVPRQPNDDYPGRCPFHADCLEGMASGPALAERFGPGEYLTGTVLADAVELEAGYLASGLRNLVYALAPERIVIGGGVARMPGLIARIAAKLRAELNGYPGLPEHAAGDFVVPAALGPMAGPWGALLLAQDAQAQ